MTFRHAFRLPRQAQRRALALAASHIALIGAALAAGPAAAGDVEVMGQDLMQNRVDRTFSSTPADGRIIDRLNKKTWTAPDTVTTPFVAPATGSNPALQTSLSQWRAALAASEREKAKALKAKDDKLKLPNQVLHAPAPVDVWVDARHNNLDTDTARGGATTTYAGADYRMNSDVLVGTMVQVDDATRSQIGSAEAASGKAFMAGPYAAYRLSDNVIVDAKTAWGQSDNEARAGDAGESFSSQRSLSQARLSGNWGEGQWKLTPSTAITHVSEETGAIPGSEGSVEETRISVRPELTREIETKNGQKIEPFAYFQSSVNVDNSDFADAAPQNTIGGGLNLSQSNDYTLSATADYSRTMADEADAALAGRVQLNVPLGTK